MSPPSPPPNRPYYLTRLPITLTVRWFLNIRDRCVGVYNSCADLAVRIDWIDCATVYTKPCEQCITIAT